MQDWNREYFLEFRKIPKERPDDKQTYLIEIELPFGEIDPSSKIVYKVVANIGEENIQLDDAGKYPSIFLVRLLNLTMQTLHKKSGILANGVTVDQKGLSEPKYEPEPMKLSEF